MISPREGRPSGGRGFVRLSRLSAACLPPGRSDEVRMFEKRTSENDLHTAQDLCRIDSSPVCGPLHALPSITLRVASQSNLEMLWDHLVRRHHYLGYQRLLGHRIKYLAFLRGRPLAALSFSAPALKLRVRDKYIGWSSAPIGHS